MAVKNIEYYTQKDGRDILKVILEPTKKYPNGYFYVDRYFEDLVRSYSWHIRSNEWNDYITAYSSSSSNQTQIRLHKEIAFRCLGHYPKYVDHGNRLGIDNVCSNLTEVTNQQNSLNRQTQGYIVGNPYKTGGSQFKPQIGLNGKVICDKSVRREDEACMYQFFLESKYFGNYKYDFLKDRRNDLEILDLERTGKISSDEATYLHVKKYVESNAWYALRYNLIDYCEHNGIIIPYYFLNDEGRMVGVDCKILCPFKKKSNNSKKSIN